MINPQPFGKDARQKSGALVVQNDGSSGRSGVLFLLFGFRGGILRFLGGPFSDPPSRFKLSMFPPALKAAFFTEDRLMLFSKANRIFPLLQGLKFCLDDCGCLSKQKSIDRLSVDADSDRGTRSGMN